MKTKFFPALLIASFLSNAYADTITVDDDGPADFNTIQEAVDYALSGDQILVSPGTYEPLPEKLYPVVDFQGKSLTLISRDGADTTIIDARNQTTPIIIGTPDDPLLPIKVEGFTIRNGQSGGISMYGDGELKVGFSVIENCREPGIWSGGDNVKLTVAQCTIRNCDSTYLSGGIMHYGGSVLLLDTMFIGNYSDTLGGAVRLWGANGTPRTAEIIRCTFQENQASQGAAISATDLLLTVDSCDFLANTGGQGTAVYLQLDAIASISNSYFCEHTEADIEGEWINLGGNTFETTCAGGCDADFDGSGTVDGADLTIMLSEWGPCTGPGNCIADLNFDGVVSGADLTILLSEWGPC